MNDPKSQPLDTSSRKKILIAGSRGLFGQKAVEVFKEDYRVIATDLWPQFLEGYDVDYRKMDITNLAETRSVIESVEPDVILNGAAYTQVDGAETEHEKCDLVNVTGVENLASVCAGNGINFLHVSTDYVFEGSKGHYNESDAANPVNYYGRSKLAGERAALKCGGSVIIARTAVLFGNGLEIPINFARWVYGELQLGNAIRVVDDQIGNPTLAEHLASACKELIENKGEGVYHVAGADAVSRHDFAVQIARSFDFDESLISRIATADFKQVATRPLDVSLDVGKLEREHDFRMPGLAQAIEEFKLTSSVYK